MHRRWTDLDSVKSVLLSSSLTIQLHNTSKDEYRLPEGLRRVGYDADERRHYFRDRDGQAWRSEPGNEYGVLTPVRDEPPVTIPRRPPASSSSTPIGELLRYSPPRYRPTRAQTARPQRNQHQHLGPSQKCSIGVEPPMSRQDQVLAGFPSWTSQGETGVGTRAGRFSAS